MAHDHEQHGAKAHGHGGPVAWDPDAERARRATRFLVWGAVLVLAGAALWYVSRPSDAPATAEPRVLDAAVELERANELLKQGKSAEAEALLREIVQAQPGEPTALVSLSTALFQQRKLADALRVAESALVTAPEDVKVLLNLATCELALERAPEALEDADHALRVEPDNAQAHFVRSRALFAAGERERALAALQRASELDPRNVAYLSQLVQLYGTLKRFGEARATTEKLALLMPGRWEPFADLHRECLELGDLVGAEQALKRALEIAPQEPEVAKLKLAFDQRQRK